MKKLLQWLASGCLSVSLSTVATADVIDGFYDVSVDVESSDAAALSGASELALQKMLIRMSGTEAVLQNPSLQEAMAQAKKYISQYGFHEQQGRTYAKFNFAPLTVERLLNGAGEPVWSADRPTVLVWLAVDQNRDIQVLKSDNELFQILQTAASERGLKLTSPLYDLQEQFALSPKQVWDMERAAVSEVSTRYGANAILIVRAWQDSRQQWHITWDSLKTQRPLVGNERCDQLVDCFQVPVAILSERWSDRYGVVKRLSAADFVQVRISGIDFKGYSALQKYLRELPAVESVAVQAVIEQDYVLNLSLLSDVDTFKDLLSLNGQLVYQGDTLAGMNYQWVN